MNDCGDSRLRSRIPTLFHKLDNAEVSDHVCWDFLLYLMERIVNTER